MEKRTVLILGASQDPARYANQAIVALTGAGYHVVPVNPRIEEVLGLQVFPSMATVESGSVDTVSLYLSPEKVGLLVDDLIALAPRRVIANPGTASVALREVVVAAGIVWVEDCTLVMLGNGTFEKS